MGLTGFNRRRKRALMEVVDDQAIVDKLVSHGVNEPKKLKEADEDDLSFLTEAEIAKCRGQEPEPIEELNVKPLKKKVAETDDVDILAEWLEVESNNKDRKSAKEAIQKRIAELEEPEEDEEPDSEPEEDSDSEEEQSKSPEKDEEEEQEKEDEPEEEVPESEKSVAERSNKFEDVPEGAEFPYEYGGNMFFLTNGDKVRGKKAAEKAQQALDEDEG